LIDPLTFARWIAPFEGRSLRVRALHPQDAAAPPPPGEVFVAATPRAFPPEVRVRRFLRFPGTSGGFVLLDAEERAVFRAGVRLLPHGRTLTRLASGLVRASSRVGLASGLAWGRLLVARRGDESPPALHERFRGLPADLRWNVASGVAGPDPRTTVQLVEQGGRVAAYAKIARGEASRARIAREAGVLDRLATLAVPAPRNLGIESSLDGTLLVQTAIEGRRAGGRFGPQQARFLARLERGTASRRALRETASHRDARARLADLEGRADREWWELMRELAQALESAAGDDPLPCAMAHGDFTDWNSVVDGDEARAFDWEFARDSAPRLHDAFHFVLQQAVLVDHEDPADLRRIVEDRTGLLPGEARLVQLAAYVLDVSLADEALEIAECPRRPLALRSRAARACLARTLVAELRSREVRAA